MVSPPSSGDTGRTDPEDDQHDRLRVGGWVRDPDLARLMPDPQPAHPAQPLAATLSDDPQPLDAPARADHDALAYHHAMAAGGGLPDDAAAGDDAAADEEL